MSDGRIGIGALEYLLGGGGFEGILRGSGGGTFL